MKKALILVDIQNDFVPGGALAVPEGDEVAPFANKIMANYELVIATQDWHPANHKSFASQYTEKNIGDQIQLDDIPQILWPDHCVQNTDGAKFVADLMSLLDETKSIRRSKGFEDYSYFYMPYFDKEVIYKLFQNKIARIFYVKKQNHILCVKLVTIHNKKACALLIGTNSEGYKLKAPAFIWFNTMKKLKEEGI